jgi:hypothetical protein
VVGNVVVVIVLLADYKRSINHSWNGQVRQKLSNGSCPWHQIGIQLWRRSTPWQGRQTECIA